MMTGEPVFSHLKLFKAPKELETPVMVRAPLACIFTMAIFCWYSNSFKRSAIYREHNRIVKQNIENYLTYRLTILFVGETPAQHKAIYILPTYTLKLCLYYNDTITLMRLLLANLQYFFDYLSINRSNLCY